MTTASFVVKLGIGDDERSVTFPNTPGLYGPESRRRTVFEIDDLERQQARALDRGDSDRYNVLERRLSVIRREHAEDMEVALAEREEILPTFEDVNGD